MTPAILLRLPVFAVVLAFLLSGAASVSARPWAAKPQPLVAGPPGQRRIVSADEGSPLLMDSGWKIIWRLQSGELSGEAWTGTYFDSVWPDGDARVASSSSLVMDSEFHQVFFVGEMGRLCVCQRVGGQWQISETCPEPVTNVLGVDQIWHAIYAYDAARGAILSIHWDQATQAWTSQLVKDGLGPVTTAGDVDSRWHILYSVHADAPGLGVPASTDPFSQPWPMVATWWDGTAYRSEVVQTTGLPQVPAVRATDNVVFFSDSVGLRQARWFRPAQNPSALRPAGSALLTSLREQSPAAKKPRATGGLLANWQGRPSFVDDKRYPVNLNAPVDYFGGTHGVIISLPNRPTGLNYNFVFSGWSGDTYYPAPPFESVAAYVPEWIPTPIPARVTGATTAVSLRRGELVQQRATHAAGNGYEARGWTQVDGIYRDARGVFFRLGPGAASQLSYGNDPTFAATPGTITVEGATFHDPLTVPGSAGSLMLNQWGFPANSNTGPVVTGAWFSIPRASAGSLKSVVSADAVDDESGPLPAPRLVPDSARLLTFGRPTSLRSKAPLPGGRYQDYAGDNYQAALAGGIACDQRTKFIVYTQAPAPSSSEYSPVWLVVVY